MSAVIRPDDPRSETSVSAPQWRAVAAHDQPLQPTKSVHELQVETLEEMILDLKQSHELELAAAREAGAREAEAAFLRDENAALAALEHQLEAAAHSLSRELAHLEKLALALCDTTLSQIFARTGDYADLIARSLEREFAHLRANCIVRAVVSRADFRSETALAEMAARHPSIKFVCDSDVTAGNCRLELLLGDLEISLPQYWSDLQARLRELSEHA